MNVRPPTYFFDIDGCILKHTGDILKIHLVEPEVLPGVHDKLKEIDRLGGKIILVSGRREGVRKETEQQLSKAGIIYDQLILGITSGVRYLYNDFKDDSTEPTAIAVNLVRNKGFKNT